MGRGAQNFFTLGHIKLDHDTKKNLNLQWNGSNTFSEVARTNPASHLPMTGLTGSDAGSERARVR